MGNNGILVTFYNKLYDIFSVYLQPEQPRKSVVVVGYGWAGKAFCDNINHKKYDVTVISKTNYMLNTPKLKNNIFRKNTKDLYVDVFGSNKEKNESITFIHDEVNDISELSRNYDYVVLAMGSITNDFGIPGVKDYCYYFKTNEDLEKLREILFTRSGQPITEKINIIIAGAGPAGLELAFEISKFSKYINITLIEALPNILPNFSESMRNTVLDELKYNNITLLTKSMIKEIKPNVIQFHGKDTQHMYDKGIFYDIAIWNCGVKPNPLIQQITNEKYLSVDSHLYFKENIYGLGDIIASKTHGPPTAQNARQQGKYLANLFNNNFVGNDFKYNEKGKIIHTKRNILIEIGENTYKVPIWCESIVDFILNMY